MSDDTVRFEPSPRWVRVIFNNQVVAGSKQMLIMLSGRRTPVYYFPKAGVRMDLLEESPRTRSGSIGEMRYFHVRAGDRTAEDAAYAWVEPNPGFAGIEDYIAFKWRAMDTWLEEDEEVFVHPRDPYKRVDVRESSRHVAVTAAGQTIAETRRPRLLFETGLPTRYYFPKTDVRLDLLEPSATVTECPYKGKAVHYSARIGDHRIEDVAWSYPLTYPEVSQIQGLIAFYPRRVDAILIDGEPASTQDDPF